MAREERFFSVFLGRMLAGLARTHSGRYQQVLLNRKRSRDQK